ncbi:polymorphic toxin-type HINT domain-containing protein [Leptospira sp. WS92.C1]
MELAKQTTSANYDSQISLMKSERDSWITDVYGFHIEGYEGSLENSNSQYRAGQAAWSDEINLFQQVELNWYLSARDVLQAAVGDPTNGEQQFQTAAMAQANSLQTLIGNSESNTSYLYNTAVGLWDSYQYSASGNLIDQAIANQQSESSWNLQGAALSQSIADSFGRTEAYQTAQLNAGLKINELITSLLGEPAEIVDHAELASLQNGALSAGQASSFWSNGNAAGFDFTGRAADNQSTIDEYSAVRADVTIASNLQSEMSDQEATFLNKAAEYFEKSERYLSLSATAESEGRFDEASYYMKLSSDQKGIASKLLNKGYNALGDTISAEVDSRGLNFTKSSFLEYKDSLLHKNFKNSTEIAKHIQSEKNAVGGILNSGKTYDEIQTMLQAAKNLIVQGNDNHTAIESLLSYSQELAQRDIGGSLLVGLEDLISSLGSQIPKDISNASVTQAVANSQKEMEEKQSGVNELLHHMNSLVTNNNDLQALQALLQGGSQSMNLAANTAIAQYLDETTRKIGKENAERSANLQKELFGAFTSGDEYKYLRDAGYEFRVSGDSISGYRQIQSGDIAIDGNAMKAESYSPVLEFQYITIQTRFDPGNVSAAMLGDLNSTSFSANLVQNVRDSLSSMQEQMEKMFSEFQDKTAELQTLHAYNQQIQEYQENQFKEIKKNVVAAFQGLEPGFQKNFKPAMSGMKEYHTEASRYNFEEGSFGSQSSKMQSAFDGIANAGGVYNGSRELKGSVNIKGIPVEVSYGMQDLLILSNFEIGALDYDFNLKGTGTSFAQEQLTTVNVKYQTYVQDVQQRIEEQAKANDAEKESKGFIFTIMNGMNTGSGSMSERFTQSVQGELQSRVTGAVAEATGLPSSFIGALVGGSSMKDAFQAFQKQTITSEISKATGIPEWVISGQMDKMNQKKEEFYETQEFQMAVSVVAIVAAPFTGGASLAAAMALNATIGAAQGAAGGGLEGALVGAVGGAVSGYVQSVTGGAVNVGLSYSKENGFGASVSVGYGPAAITAGITEHGGATVGLGLQYKGLNAGLNYNSKTGDVDGNIGFSTEGGGSLALSYSQQSGIGVNAGYNHSSGAGANVGWSEKDGFGGGLSYGVPQNEAKSNRWAGTGANVNWSQNGGTSVNLTAGAGEKYGADGVSRTPVPGKNNAPKFGSGGATAGTWSSEGGFQANGNFLNDKWTQDYLADAEDRREKQEQNNQRQGADALSALGTRRREDDVLGHIMGNAGDADSLCFVAGTLVLTSKGLIPIESVKVGDEVLAYNPETKDQSLKKVVRLFQNENSELLTINFGEGEEVKTTSGHRFFTENRGFVLASELTTKDIFLDKVGETISIHSITKEKHKEKIPVFNFEVEEYHTYYVGETCILVHNDSVKMLQEKIAANGELNGPLVNKGIDKILDQVYSFDKNKSGNVEAALKDFAKMNGLSESSPEYKKLKELTSEVGGAKSKGFNESRMEYYAQNKDRIHTEALISMYGDKIQSIDGNQLILKNGEGVTITNGKYDLQLDNKTSMYFKREHENFLGVRSSDPDYHLKPSAQCFPTTNAVMADHVGAIPKDPSKQMVDDMLSTAREKGILNENNHTSGGEEMKTYAGAERLNKEYGLNQNMLLYPNKATFEDKKIVIQQAIRDGHIVSAGGKFPVGDHRNAIVGYDSKGWVVFDPYGNANTKGYGGNGMFAHYEYGKFNLAGNQAYYVTKDK